MVNKENGVKHEFTVTKWHTNYDFFNIATAIYNKEFLVQKYMVGKRFCQNLGLNLEQLLYTNHYTPTPTFLYIAWVNRIFLFRFNIVKLIFIITLYVYHVGILNVFLNFIITYMLANVSDHNDTLSVESQIRSVSQLWNLAQPSLYLSLYLPNALFPSVASCQ